MIYYDRSDSMFLLGDFKKSLVITVNNQTSDDLQNLCNEISEAFDTLEFGKIVVGVKMSDAIGGYYTKKMHCPGIYLPQNKNSCKIDLINQKFIINFTPENFSVFVHEASHFLHIERDKGVWLQPNISIDPLKDLTLLNNSGVKKNALYRRCAELEAGYRSVKMIKKYNLSKEYGKLNFINQIKNILFYDIDKQSWYKRYLSIDKKLKNEKEINNLFDEIVTIFADKYSMTSITIDKMQVTEDTIDEILKKYENMEN